MAATNGDRPPVLAGEAGSARELFLIDGNSLAYRAFFALPESIATSDGRPTNAILGFASMLVKILTDDGDAYQLIGQGVRIMTTSRGITDTKVYDRQGVIDRYGIPPELVPDFIGLKGDTSDNIPGVPGIGDKTAAELLQRFGSLEAVLDSVDEISGAKRKQNLTEHAEDARVAAQSAAIPRPETATARAVATRKGTVADVANLSGAELALVALAPEIPEGELLARESGWHFGAYAGGPHAIAGEVEDPAQLVAAAGDRPVIAHDAKALGEVPRNLTWDTEVAAYLLDPARRGYPLDELCEERGMAVDAEDPQAARAVLAHELAGRQRDQVVERGLEGLLREIELPLVHVLRECEKAGVKIDTGLLEQFGRRIRADAAELEREIWELAGEEFMIGSTQQLAEVLFVKLGLSRKRGGKTGFSTHAGVLHAILHHHPIIPG